jgi:hypothetical protein
MSNSDAIKLERIITDSLKIKHSLAPESVTDEKKQTMETIRLAFPQLEKRDCTTVYSCMKLIMPTVCKTLAIARKLIPKFKQLIPFLFKRDSYSSSEIHFGQIREIFNESPPLVREYVHSTMRTTGRQKKIQAAKADERVESKLLNPFRVSLRDFLENIARDAESTSFGPLLSALESASGSRAIELISKSVSTFEAVPNLPGFIRQTGQAKARGKKVEPVKKPIIGMSVNRFLNRLAFIRQTTDQDVDAGMDNKGLARKYEPDAVAHVQSIYPSLGKGAGTHKMRAAYSKASYMIHNPNEEISPSEWMKRVLGHGSYNSLKNYDSVIVTRGPSVKPADLPMAIIEINARVSALEEKRSNEQDEKEVDHIVVLINNKKRKIEEIEFTKTDGVDVKIKKIQRIRGKTEEETFALVRRAEKLLRDNGVKVTKENIVRLGIGSTNVSKYRTK